MGWWGHGIIDGDTPSDYNFTALELVAGKEKTEELLDDGSFTENILLEDYSKALKENRDKLFSLAMKDKHDRDVCLTVFGWLMWKADVRLSKKQYSKVMDAIKNEGHAALYYDDPGKRLEALDALILGLRTVAGESYMVVHEVLAVKQVHDYHDVEHLRYEINDLNPSVPIKATELVVLLNNETSGYWGLFWTGRKPSKKVVRRLCENYLTSYLHVDFTSGEHKLTVKF